MTSQAFQEHGDAVLAALQAGASIEEAARDRVGPRTIDRWLARGREDPTSPYGPMARVIEERTRAAEVATSDADAPMTPGEFQHHLDAAVRAGSVQAMKLWDERDRRGVEQPEPQTTSKIASLAERRRRKEAG